LGVNGGIVHGILVESLTFWGVNGGVVHGRGFESLPFRVNGGVVHGRGFESLIFGGQWWCNNHLQNQQSQPSPTQAIEATRLVSIVLS
jgi:hypothetical protein